MGLGELTVSQEVNIGDDLEKDWIGDRYKPEVEFDDEQQDVDRESMKYINNDK